MTEAEKGPSHSKFIFSEMLSKLFEQLAGESDPKKLEIAKKRIELINKTGAERDANIKLEQLEAEKLVKIVQSKQENITPWMKQWNQENKYKQRLPIDKAQQKLELALKTSQDNIRWAEITDAKEIKSSAAAEFLSVVSLLPKELAEDPNVFFRLTSKFAASMNEVPTAYAQEIQILNKAIIHQEEMRKANLDKGFTLNKEDTIFTLRGVVIYDEGLGDRIDATAVNYLHDLQEVFDNNKSKLTSMEKENLRNRKKELERGVFDIISPGKNDKGVDTGRNIKNPQHLAPEKTKVQVQRINRRLEEIELQEESNRSTSKYHESKASSEKNVKDIRWVDARIARPELMYESSDNPGVILDRSALHNVLDRLNAEADNPREDVINALYKELKALPETSKKDILDKDGNYIKQVSQVTEADIEPFAETIEKSYVAMHGDRDNYDNNYRETMLTPLGREEHFFKIMRVVTGNPNLSSRELMDLPFTQDWRTFIYALNEIDFSQMELPKGMTPVRAREALIGRFTNLRESLVALHDIDFQARSAAGDIKNFKGALAYFQNHYFVEAIQDPIVQELARCYEEALKQIRDNNGGWIPPDQVYYNPKTSENEWDRRARELFIQRAQAGTIYEIKRDSLGTPIPDRSGKRFVKGDKFVYNEHDRVQEEKLKAAMQMGKGTGIVSMRLLEIFAFSKTPGYDTRPNSQVFGSKAYEGIARWLNPMADFFGKFKQGDQKHFALFSALIGIEQSDIVSWLRFKPDQFIKIQELALTGKLDTWLREHYPKEGEAHVKRMRDAVELFSFSGRMGPLSQWGTVDMTTGMSELEKERMGGSMRIQRAAHYAAGVVSEKYKNHPVDKALRKEYPNWERMSKDERKTAKDKLLADRPEFTNPIRNLERDLEYYKLQRNMKDRAPYDEEAAVIAGAYKTFVYAQMAERSPVIIAHGVEDRYHMERLGNTDTPKLLRTVILEDILKDDTETKKILKIAYADKHGGDMSKMKDEDLKFDMAKHAIALSTPSLSQMEMTDRINLLEDDVTMMQRIALNGGPDGAPRSIIQEDLNVILGERVLIRNGEQFATVDQITRREQAWKYVQAVREKMLGKGETAEGIRDRLGATYEEGKLIIAKPEKLKDILKDAKNNMTLLDGELLVKKEATHMGTEDVQWSYLDVSALGPRNPARRGNDLEVRVNTIVLMQQYFDLLSGHPDIDALAKHLGKIKVSESGHDPKEGHKFAWLLANMTGQLYRQGKLAYIPFAGKLLQQFMEVSAAQYIEGKTEADAWSANNMHHFLEKVKDQTGIPAKPINVNGELEEWNAESLEHTLSATKRIAFTEAIILGYSIAAATFGLSAATKSLDDENKK